MSSKSFALVVKFAGQDKLSGVFQILSGHAGKAKQNMVALKESVRAQRQELKVLESSMVTVGPPTKAFIDEQKRLKDRLEDTTKALDDQKDAVTTFGKAQAKAKSLQNNGTQMMSAGAVTVGVGVAAAAPLVVAAKEAMTFQSSMAGVKKVMDFPTDSFDKLNHDILDLSTRVPIAAEGLANIAAAAARSGVGSQALKAGNFTAARNDLVAFTESAAKMGVAFDISADQAGETMAKWRTVFSLNQQGVVALGDQINALTNAYGGNAATITEAVTRVGSLGKVAGVSASQITAMAHVISSAGVESEITATGMKNMMLAMTKGASATKSQQQALSALGINATDLAKRMQTDAGGAIIDLLSRLSKLPKAVQAGVLTDIFGSESVAAIAPLLTNLDQLKTNFQLVGDSSKYAGSMNAEFLSRIATAEGATGLFGNSLKAINTEIGLGMLPAITAASNALTPMVNAWRKWGEEHPKTTAFITTFVAVSAGLLIALGSIGVAVGAASFAFGALGITTTAALWPVLAVIAGIAGIVAVITLVAQYWDPLVAGFSAFGAVIAQAFKPAIDGAITVFNLLKNVIMNFTPLGWFLKAFNPVFDWLGKLDWKTIGQNMIQGVIDGIFGMLGPLGQVFKKAADAGINAFKQKAEIKSPSRVMMRMGQFMTDGLGIGIEKGQSTPMAQMKTLAAGMAAASLTLAPVPLMAQAQILAQDKSPIPQATPMQVPQNPIEVTHLTETKSDNVNALLAAINKGPQPPQSPMPMVPVPAPLAAHLNPIEVTHLTETKSDNVNALLAAINKGPKPPQSPMPMALNAPAILGSQAATNNSTTNNTRSNHISNTSQNITQPITINIYATPNQSADDIAKAVRQEMERHTRAQQARQRSSFDDA